MGFNIRQSEVEIGLRITIPRVLYLFSLYNQHMSTQQYRSRILLPCPAISTRRLVCPSLFSSRQTDHLPYVPFSFSFPYPYLRSALRRHDASESSIPYESSENGTSSLGPEIRSISLPSANSGQRGFASTPPSVQLCVLAPLSQSSNERPPYFNPQSRLEDLAEAYSLPSGSLSEPWALAIGFLLRWTSRHPPE